MKSIYKKIWEFARPYYKKGRPTDIIHIQWMMKIATHVCQKEDLDDALLLPLVILHDVGYAKVPKMNPFKPTTRIAHMEAGAKISKSILTKVRYPQEKIKKIVQYVSIHDNWAFGENTLYQQDPILGAFNDLDYMWMATPQGFSAMMKTLRKNKQELIEYLEKNDKLKLRPFATKTTKNLYKKYLLDRKKGI